MRRLPCGCSTDGSIVCEEHRTLSFSAAARAVGEEALRLAAVSLFVGIVLVWAAIAQMP